MESVKFQLGDIVYLLIDPEEKGMITRIIYRPHGVMYYVTWNSDREQSHFDIELTTEARFGCAADKP